MARLDTIKSKLEALRNLDKRFVIFGATTHQYKMRNTLSVEEIQTIEKENDITIPEEYKEFLLHLGCAGAGCGEEGLLTPHIREVGVITEMDVLGESEITLKSIDMHISRLTGSSKYIRLFDYGSGIETTLVLNGKEAGKLVTYDAEGRFRIEEAGFLDTYEFWLDSSLLALNFVKEKLKNLPYEEIEIDRKDVGYYFPDVLMYSIMDVDFPRLGTHTEEHETYMKNAQKQWLATLSS
ncbi:MAG: SMI1/KNR4 family protein [Saprospiraceae bacterium]|nr:SMI1/KNR4 family protein [Saprospiraceae bacterium]